MHIIQEKNILNVLIKIIYILIAIIKFSFLLTVTKLYYGDYKMNQHSYYIFVYIYVQFVLTINQLNQFSNVDHEKKEKEKRCLTI